MPSLLTDAERAKLLANGADFETDEDYDPIPVVKLFSPVANAAWLLTHLDPELPDYAFGLCDLGVGFPEIGIFNLTEVESLRGPMRQAVTRDEQFVGTKPLSEYAAAARRAGGIVTD
jgi:hypothetical protein